MGSPKAEHGDRSASAGVDRITPSVTARSAGTRSRKVQRFIVNPCPATGPAGAIRPATGPHISRSGESTDYSAGAGSLPPRCGRPRPSGLEVLPALREPPPQLADPARRQPEPAGHLAGPPAGRQGVEDLAVPPPRTPPATAGSRPGTPPGPGPACGCCPPAPRPAAGRAGTSGSRPVMVNPCRRRATGESTSRAESARASRRPARTAWEDRRASVEMNPAGSFPRRVSDAKVFQARAITSAWRSARSCGQRTYRTANRAWASIRGRWARNAACSVGGAVIGWPPRAGPPDAGRPLDEEPPGHPGG